MELSLTYCNNLPTNDKVLGGPRILVPTSEHDDF